MSHRAPAGDFRRQYDALTLGAGWCPMGHRTQIVVTGKDRASFLHNLCTNDIKRLRPGTGCEAFLTSAQGKTLGFVLVFCHEDRLVVETVADQATRLIAHLDRYIIREDVQLADRSQSRAEVLLSGALTSRRLVDLQLPVPEDPLDHAGGRLGESPVSVRRVRIAGPNSFLIDAASDQMDATAQWLDRAKLEPCCEAALEAVRIEAGWPVFGQDVTDANLPQEIDRDKLAISFSKGCYLGQETVARIDSMGHVNRKLTRVRFFASDVPALATRLVDGDREAGQVTSSAFSPRFDAPLALALVRCEHLTPGTRLQSDAGEAEVMPPG